MWRRRRRQGKKRWPVFYSVRYHAHLISSVCCIMDAAYPPAVKPDPTTQPSSPVSPLSSLLKRAPTCLFSDSKAWSSLCPFFLLPLWILYLLSIHTQGNGGQTSVCHRLLNWLFTMFCLKTGLIFQSPEKVFAAPRVVQQDFFVFVNLIQVIAVTSFYMEVICRILIIYLL